MSDGPWKLVPKGEPFKLGDECLNPLASRPDSWLPLTPQDLEIWNGTGLPVRRRMTIAEVHADMLWEQLLAMRKAAWGLCHAVMEDDTPFKVGLDAAEAGAFAQVKLADDLIRLVNEGMGGKP
jgi:hypothetical protein